MQAILWASDLHLDHAAAPRCDAFFAALRDAAGRPVVVTGDTSVAGRMVDDLQRLADAAAQPLYFVLGNHDHYGSSVGEVRDAVIDLAEGRSSIQWLPPAGVVALDDRTALIGVDGWADGRYGDPLTTPLVLNDDRRIAELAAQPTRAGKLAVRQALADGDATRLATLLERATRDARRIVVATHVPPFPEALPPDGRLSSPQWQPLLLCRATGDVLRRAAAEHPEHEFLVLAGHTHVATDVRVASNLRCIVAGARYGAPGVISLEI